MSQGKAIFTIGMLNLIGSAIGAANVVLLAYYFGASREIELFMAATAMLLTVQHLTATGLLSEVFLPKYIEIKTDKGFSDAMKAFNVLLNHMLILSIGIVLLGYTFSDALIKVRVPGFSTEDIAHGAEMLRILMPLIAVRIITALFRPIIQAEKKFGGPELMVVIGRLGNLLCIVFLVPEFGIDALLLGFWVSFAVTFLGTVAIAISLGWRPFFSLRHRHFHGLSIGKSFFASFYFIGGEEVLRIAKDSAVSFLPEGSFAVVGYVAQIFQRLNGVTLKPVASVFFIYFSEALRLGVSSLNQLIHRAIDRSLGIAILMFLLMFASSEYILFALFGIEKFTPAQLSLFAFLLPVQCAMLSLAGTNMIYRKICASYQVMPTFFKYQLYAKVPLALLTWFLIYNFAITGLVVSLFMGYLPTLFISHYLISKNTSGVVLRPPIKVFQIWLLVLFVALLVVMGLKVYIPEVESRWLGLLYTLFTSGLMLVVIYITARVMGQKDTLRLESIMLNKLKLITKR